MTTPWYEHDEALLAEELAALRLVCDDVRIDPEARELGYLVVYGELDADRLGRTKIAVVYPGTYPHTRPAVYQMEGERLGRHQHRATGNYCLLGRAPEQWRPSMRAASLVADIPALVRRVDAGGDELTDAEDPQGEPQTAYFDTLPGVSIIVPEAIRDLDFEPGASGKMNVLFAREKAPLVAHMRGEPLSAGQGLLVEMLDADGNEILVAPDELMERFSGQEMEGTWTAVGEDVELPTDPEQLHAELAARNPASQKRYSSARKVVGGGPKATVDLHSIVMPEEVRQGEYAPGLLFVAQRLRQLSHGAPWQADRLQPVRAHIIGPNSLMERIKTLRSLRDATVAVVGLGTLGAPIVQMLAQAQTGVILPADYDTVDPNTTVRWPGGLPSAEIPKAELLRNDLTTRYPFITVTPVPLRVGLTPHPRHVLEVDPDSVTLGELLDGTNLLIDATAHENASSAMNAATRTCGIAQLVVYSVDGYGGVVALLRPGETGCHHCLLIALAEGGDIAPPPDADDPDSTRVQPRGCDEPTFVAVVPDLMPLATQAARVAMSYLTRDDDAGYGQIEDDVFVLSIRRPDGTPLAVPQWRSHPLPVDPRCPNCA